MVIWITGISGAGKSTIANALMKLLKKNFSELINIDGDEVRDVFEEKLGYTEDDRILHIKRIQRLCLLLDRQKQIVITSALYSNTDLLDWNRKYFSEYYEIYLDAPIDLVKKRDTKGLYNKYAEGIEKNIVGIDIPWHAPSKSDLKIDFKNNYSVNDIINKIIKIVPRFKNIDSKKES
jgi:cytidine diphosphoramidate kinase